MSTIAVCVLAFASMPMLGSTDDYLLFFAGEQDRYQPAKSHTFATLVRVCHHPNGRCEVLSVDTISWLPTNLRVRAFAFCPEPGWNFSMEETFDYVFAAGGYVACWGPYRVHPQLANSFRARKYELDTEHRYKGLNLIGRPKVDECVGGVDGINPGRGRIGIFGYGENSTGRIVDLCSPYFLDKGRCHPWLLRLLGMEGAPLRFRSTGERPTKIQNLESYLGSQKPRPR
jgi:hypothetical protein